MLSAPPRVTGNRPVVIESPLSEVDDEHPVPAAPRLLATAQPEAQGLPAGSAEPEQRTAAGELRKARESILKYSTLQAQVVETVAISDRRYKAEGRYLQLGLRNNDWHMRLELALKVGDSEGSLLEVCDGDVLWTSTQVEAGRKSSKKEKKEQSVVRRNVTQILEAARKHGDQAEARTISELGLGGIPGLLAAMEQEMTFTGIKDDVLRDVPVVVVQGTWNEAFMGRLLPPKQQGSSPLLPPFVPDSVQVFIDRATGFPHRLLYLKKLPGRTVQRAMLTFDFINVTINEPIDKTEFAYEAPSGVQPVELTKFYLDRLEALGGAQPPATPPK